MSQLKCLFSVVLTLAIFCSPSRAETLWTKNTIALLSGNDFRVNSSPESDDSERIIVTLEHASGHSWGDIYFFLDRFESSDNAGGIYAEVTPRWSIGDAIGWENDGFIKDLLLAGTLERSSKDTAPGRDDTFTNVLVGLGGSLDMPGFNFFNANIFRAKNENQNDDWQLTMTWSIDGAIGNSQWLYDGFIDWSSAADDHRASIAWVSQLKLDLGKYWGKPEKVYAGIEYVYWHNKFGIKHNEFGFATHERNVNLLLKLHW